jgi:hypothetical protein
MAQVLQAISSGGKQYYATIVSNLVFAGQVASSPISGSYLASGNYGLLGFEGDLLTGPNAKTKMLFDVYIPDNFTIREARVIINHFPLKVYDKTSAFAGWGYSRAIKLYKAENQNIYREYTPSSEWKDIENETYLEAINVLGIDGYTPSIPSDTNHNLENYVSEDIKSNLKKGLTRLKIESSIAVPTSVWSSESANYATTIDCALKSGMVSARIMVIGDAK